MQYLDLSRNYCFQLNPFFFSHMPSLITVLLYENRLGRPLANDLEGMTFSFLTLLETIDLSDNVIEELSELTFKNNRNLRRLNLSNNELRYFHPSLVNNTKLEELDLSSNLLVGFSQHTCKQFLDIKTNNANFTVRIGNNNEFLCSCENLYFLRFILENPELFDHARDFHCRFENGSVVSYDKLEAFLPQLALQCVTQSVFFVVLVAFFLMTGALAGCALYHYKRWQWKYLYYIVKSRLHIGSTHITCRPVAHAFVTYDQDNSRLRRMMRHLILPRLHQLGVTTVLGETDFEGGPLGPSIAGAVTSTGKTLVFLSKDIFQEFYRQTEVNLAIMHELHLRRPVLVPVLLLRPETLPEVRQAPEENSEPCSLDSVSEESFQSQDERGAAEQTLNGGRRSQRGDRPSDDLRRFVELLSHFPPEISTFLHGQVHRCLVYTGDNQCFWLRLRAAILEE